MVNPAVRPGNRFLEIARQAGARIDTEIGLFLRACPARVDRRDRLQRQIDHGRHDGGHPPGRRASAPGSAAISAAACWTSSDEIRPRRLGRAGAEQFPVVAPRRRRADAAGGRGDRLLAQPPRLARALRRLRGRQAADPHRPDGRRPGRAQYLRRRGRFVEPPGAGPAGAARAAGRGSRRCRCRAGTTASTRPARPPRPPHRRAAGFIRGLPAPPPRFASAAWRPLPACRNGWSGSPWWPAGASTTIRRPPRPSRPSPRWRPSIGRSGCWPGARQGVRFRPAGRGDRPPCARRGLVRRGGARCLRGRIAAEDPRLPCTAVETMAEALPWCWDRSRAGGSRSCFRRPVPVTISSATSASAASSCVVLVGRSDIVDTAGVSEMA